MADLKNFTVEQANRALPLVRRIARDLVDKVGQFRELERARLAARRAQDAGEEKRIGARLFDLEGAIERHLGEVEALGLDVKDAGRGLLDFPAVSGGEKICLCWLFDEPSVSWWHSLESGFAGRRPVDELPAQTRGASGAARE